MEMSHDGFSSRVSALLGYDHPDGMKYLRVKLNSYSHHAIMHQQKLKIKGFIFGKIPILRGENSVFFDPLHERCSNNLGLAIYG